MESSGVREALERRFLATVLLEPVLRPLEDAMGEYGAIAAQPFAQAIASMMERT
jgi:hypothetical protein